MDTLEDKEPLTSHSEEQSETKNNADTPPVKLEDAVENTLNSNKSADTEEAIDGNINKGTEEIEETGEDNNDRKGDQNVENKVGVGKQTNIKEQFGDVMSPGRDAYKINSLTFLNQEKSTEKYKTIDPSKPLKFDSRIPPGLFNNKHKKDILKHRVIYIVCPDNLLALEAAWFLYNSLNQDKKDLKSKVIAPANPEEEEQSRNISSLVQNEKTKTSILTNTFLVVDFRDNVFLDTTLKMNLGVAQGITTKLGDNDSFLAILVHRDVHIRSILASDDIFCSWKIDFVATLLGVYDMQEYVQEVKKQKEQGFWGDTDIAFCRSINTYAKESKSRLLQEIKERVKRDEEQDVKDFIKQNIEKETVEKIIKISPLSRYVCFIATYFPKISLANLRRLLKIIVEEEPLVQVLRIRINKKGKQKEKWVETSLWELWNDEEKGGDNVLFDSFIKVYENDVDQKDYYCFSEPYLLESFKDFFEKGRGRRFLQKSFKKIWESGVFFEELTRDYFLLDLATLSTKMAVKDKEEFGIKVLLNILGKVHYLEDKEYSEELILNKLFANLKKHHILNRMCFLMSEMIKYNKLKDDVYSALNHQIAFSRHEVVFDIIKRLHYSPDFDSLMWLKRLIDNGNRAVKRKAYQYLIENIIENPEQIDYYLTTIYAWQEDIKDNEHHSLSAYSSLLFIVDYSLRLEVENYGVFPTPYPLLANSNEKTLDDFSVKIIKWIFHPKMKAAIDEIRKLFKQEPISTIIVYSDILEYWYKIICGQLVKEGSNQEKLFLLVLEEILKHCDTKRREAIVVAFNNKLKFIELKIVEIRNILPSRNQIKLKDEIISAWKERHQNVNQLKDRFKKIAF